MVALGPVGVVVVVPASLDLGSAGRGRPLGRMPLDEGKGLGIGGEGLVTRRGEDRLEAALRDTDLDS